MTREILIRKSGCAGRITLTRPDAMNALTYDMCQRIEAALDSWATDETVKLVIIDAEGDAAFCAGGDIVDMYRTGKNGDYAYGRKYWADEYRLNAKIYDFPKPYVAFMQGYTMGGGVGVSCHGSHRVVCENSQIAMPECGIGLVPDVGGSLLLARAPGRWGEYLGATGTRMGPDDAIRAEFADYFIPRDQWPGLIAALESTGNYSLIDAKAVVPPPGKLASISSDIDTHFAGETIGDIFRSLLGDPGEFCQNTIKVMRRHSPLSLACTIEMIHRTRGTDNIYRALDLEYRFTYRAAEHGDFIEGIRAAIIDKDRTPVWKHKTVDHIPPVEVSKMLMPLGAHALKL